MKFLNLFSIVFVFMPLAFLNASDEIYEWDSSFFEDNQSSEMTYNQVFAIDPSAYLNIKQCAEGKLTEKLRIREKLF